MEYLHELREQHRTQHIDCEIREVVKEGEVVVIFNESHSRTLWRLGKIEGVIHSTDSNVWGAVVRTQTKLGNPTLLRWLIQQLHPPTTTAGDKIDDGVKELTAASAPANSEASSCFDSQQRTHPRRETEYWDAPSEIELDCLSFPCLLHVYLVVNPRLTYWYWTVSCSVGECGVSIICIY